MKGYKVEIVHGNVSKKVFAVARNSKAALKKVIHDKFALNCSGNEDISIKVTKQSNNT